MWLEENIFKIKTILLRFDWLRTCMLCRSYTARRLSARVACTPRATWTPCWAHAGNTRDTCTHAACVRIRSSPGWSGACWAWRSACSATGGTGPIAWGERRVRASRSDRGWSGACWAWRSVCSATGGTGPIAWGERRVRASRSDRGWSGACWAWRSACSATGGTGPIASGGRSLVHLCRYLMC